MLTRVGYHTLVIFWLAVLGLIDVVCNTIFTGVVSDLYFYKVFVDLVIAGWTWTYLQEDFSGKVVKSSSSRAQEAVVKVNLGAAEYIYYGFLFLYGFGNLYFHHMINKNSTGILSMSTLALSVVDAIVAVVGAVNFIQVASGKIVKISEKIPT